jgi:hypothetical protein
LLNFCKSSYDFFAALLVNWKPAATLRSRLPIVEVHDDASFTEYLGRTVGGRSDRPNLGDAGG